ncbi:MAG: hypothetical protein AAB434_08615 [Planctomycetota bacterium]
MRPSQQRSGITLLHLLVVLFVLSVLGSFLVVNVVSDRRREAELRAEAALKQLVSIEGVWRNTDSDRNGAQEYWTADVAGFYAVTDANGAPLRYIDGKIAGADVAPAMKYPRLPVYDRSTGYHVRAMITDEDGAPYVERGYAPAAAAPVTGLYCMNCIKFAFCAWLDGSWGRADTAFIVNEEGVVYRADMDGPAPVTIWPGASDWPATPLSPPWKPTD